MKHQCNETEERRIIFKYDPSIFEYLRQGSAYSGRAIGPLRGWNGGGCWVKDMPALIKVANSDKESRFLMIGYEEVGEKVATRVYRRKYWWLKSYDKDLQPEGVYKERRPAEATTIFASIPITEERDRVLVGISNSE